MNMVEEPESSLSETDLSYPHRIRCRICGWVTLYHRTPDGVWAEWVPHRDGHSPQERSLFYG